MDLSCNHIGKGCAEVSCGCTCSVCQDAFETEWERLVAVKGMCADCGMPGRLSPESLKEFEYLHFYLPCAACRPGYEAYIASVDLCGICRTRLRGRKACVACCCEDTEFCPCRECRQYRGEQWQGACSQQDDCRCMWCITPRASQGSRA